LAGTTLTKEKIRQIQDTYAATRNTEETARVCGVTPGSVRRYRDAAPVEQQVAPVKPLQAIQPQSVESQTGLEPLALLLKNSPLKLEEIKSALGLNDWDVMPLLMRARAELGVECDQQGRYFLPTIEAPSGVSADRKARAMKQEIETLGKKYKEALGQIEESDLRLNAMLSVKQHVEPIRIEPDPSISGGQATALWLASDWHVGERVDGHTINYINEYNPEIAERRAINFFRNGLKLVRKERQDVQIDTLILWLGGDLISGYIHDELEESNYLSPTEEARLAKRLIIGGLKMLKENGDFKQIIVPCSFGNHGRTTKKRRVSTGYKNSYEWMLYNDLADLFDGDEVIKFQVTNGYLNYLQCYDKRLRFHHGDNVSYQGGVGGVTIPLNKFIARTNQQQWADLDSIGHYHQRTPYAYWCRFQINGSLIGFNSFAQSIGASPEEPVQNFQLIDSTRGLTIAAPIKVIEEVEGRISKSITGWTSRQEMKA